MEDKQSACALPLPRYHREIQPFHEAEFLALSNRQQKEGFYLFSNPDENNNVSIFDYKYSLIQELNIAKNSTLVKVADNLYVYNRDKLSISKILFSGTKFAINKLSFSQITSVLPGVNIINLDSYSSYDIYIEKDNAAASYIILTRYSQGFADYKLSVVKGEVKNLPFENSFSVNSQNTIELAYKHVNSSDDIISQNNPTYKFIIRTKGVVEEPIEDEYTSFDEKTATDEQETEKYTPNIMPKIENNTDEYSQEDISSDELPTAPKQGLEPPED